MDVIALAVFANAVLVKNADLRSGVFDLDQRSTVITALSSDISAVLDRRHCSSHRPDTEVNKSCVASICLDEVGSHGVFHVAGDKCVLLNKHTSSGSFRTPGPCAS